MKTASCSNHWKNALELSADRSVAAGTCEELCDAIRAGADLRVYTEWTFEEHVAPGLPGPRDVADNGLLREVIDFHETMLVDDRYAAGITTLRQPILPVAEGFNPTVTPRMSFFMYGMDGQQATAGLSLNHAVVPESPGNRTVIPRGAEMPKMGDEEIHDSGTLAPSRNFIYDFETIRFFVRDDWTPILSHDEAGGVIDGSWDALQSAHAAGRELKVALRDLNADLGGGIGHEVFTLLGSGWVHTGRQRFETLTHPIVRIAAGIPVVYKSHKWDVVWAYVRTDGSAVLRRLDPYTRTFEDRPTRLACRWFVR